MGIPILKIHMMKQQQEITELINVMPSPKYFSVYFSMPIVPIIILLVFIVLLGSVN